MGSEVEAACAAAIIYFNVEAHDADMEDTDPRLVAARVSLTSQIAVGDAKAVQVREILDAPERAATLVPRHA